MDKIKASKFMSLVLRHDPAAAGVALDANGWVAIDDLLGGMNRAGFPVTREVLNEIVREDTKQRCAISDDGLRIRANQGHSVAVDVGLVAVAPPDVLFHGTGRKSRDAILRQGLKPMSRQHLHLSPDTATALVVGRRHGKPVIFRIDAKRMAEAGMAFYRSANGVWLTGYVPPEFLSEVTSM